MNQSHCSPLHLGDEGFWLVHPQLFDERSCETREVRYKQPKGIAQSQEKVQFCFCGAVFEFFDSVRSKFRKFQSARPSTVA